MEIVLSKGYHRGINYDRLELVRSVLAGIIAEGRPFDQGAGAVKVNKLAGYNARRPGFELNDDRTVKAVDPGTPSDVIGWVARDPRGQALGLGLMYRAARQFDDLYHYYIEAYMLKENHDADENDEPATSYVGNVWGMERQHKLDRSEERASTAFFLQASNTMAAFLFDPQRYPEGRAVTPQAILARVDWLLDGHLGDGTNRRLDWAELWHEPTADWASVR